MKNSVMSNKNMRLKWKCKVKPCRNIYNDSIRKKKKNMCTKGDFILKVLTFIFFVVLWNDTLVNWVISCTFAMYAAHLLVEYKQTNLLRLLLSGNDSVFYYQNALYSLSSCTRHSWKPTCRRICRGQAVRHRIVHRHACTIHQHLAQLWHSIERPW